MTPKHIILIFLLLYSISCKQINTDKQAAKDSISFVQIKADSIYDSKQIISILTVPKNLLNTYKIEFGYDKLELQKTSAIALSKHAEMAINGGFFNRDSGGSVTYFEVSDSVIGPAEHPGHKWNFPDSLVNGAIVLTKADALILEPARTNLFYKNSHEEEAVLVTGPLLLLNSKAVRLPVSEFVTRRHPRTCIGKNEDAILFITIDGRSADAAGMNLYELQGYLKNLGCVDAINLDGGGSTTMWLKQKGIVNFPSDKAGERSVSNALLLIKKETH